MTRKDARAVLKALADWEPVGTSIELMPIDRSRLREGAVFAIADALGFEDEEALTILEAARMLA